MKPYRDAALTFLAATFGLWFFQDTLSENMLDQKLMRQQIIESTVLTVGVKGGKCSANVHLSTWDDMNQLAIYRWVVACEEAKE